MNEEIARIARQSPAQNLHHGTKRNTERDGKAHVDENTGQRRRALQSGRRSDLTGDTCGVSAGCCRIERNDNDFRQPAGQADEQAGSQQAVR